MDDKKYTFKIGVGGGILSTLCCVPAYIFVILGFGASSFLLSLSNYKLEFFLLGLVTTTIGIALYLREQIKNNKCSNCGIKDTVRNQWKNISIAFLTMISTYVFILYVILPATLSYMTTKGPYISPECNAKIYISPFSCAGCTAAMIKELENLYGINKVEYLGDKIILYYDSSKIRYDEIESNIKLMMAEFDIKVQKIENSC